ncbi:unnamed protein product [Owenia fusiformis]|uniref:Uncharacterized protein n=1 Tax=Owenia fusiformis TaxID=6347 RepID=A0A8S4PFX7_OWEFU|nr:unnamed protein product [Owenia fusiformis]
MRFIGKGIIVTGSNSGIGKATALLFAKEGANVLIHGRDLNSLEQTLEECKAVGLGTAKFAVVQGSFDNKDLIKKIHDTAVSEFGRIDVLVNNAGQAEIGSSLTTTEDSFDRQMHLLLKVPIFLSQMCFSHLKKSKGNIVNISSIAGIRASSRDSFSYAIAKAALNQFTQCAGIEYGAEGVRVNAVCPGYIRTNMGLKSESSVNNLAEANARYDEIAKAVPTKKVGTAEEAAKLIVFLASEDASMMNGACVVQDGGHSLMGLDNQTIENAAKCN